MSSCVTKAQISEEERESFGSPSQPSNPSSKTNLPASRSGFPSTLQDCHILEAAGSESRSLKAALQVTIRAQTVTEEVLHTVLIEIEGVLNSKPLSYISSDIADPDPITPNCLLMGRRDASLPQVVYDGSEILGQRRWQHSQILADQFWKHFLKHYLPGLQARQKWRTEAVNLQVGDIVMIVDNQLPCAGKVTQVFPGVDNGVPSAEVLVKDRTVARLISLPALPEEE